MIQQRVIKMNYSNKKKKKKRVNQKSKKEMKSKLESK